MKIVRMSMPDMREREDFLEYVEDLVLECPLLFGLETKDVVGKHLIVTEYMEREFNLTLGCHIYNVEISLHEIDGRRSNERR